MNLETSRPSLAGQQFAQVDEELALGRVGGDFELLQEVVGLFLDEYPKTLGELRTALAAGDASGVERHAHSLKGSVSTFGAQTVFESALALEKLGRAGCLSEAPAALINLEHALTDLRPELEALLAR